MLEDNFEKKPIPRKECPTKEIDENVRLAESLGITGTPTLVFSDGRVQSGAVPASRLIELVDGRK